jgi:hypothetical protein
LTKDNIKKIASSFESFRGNLYNFGAINGSHTPIIAIKIDPKSYYFQKKIISHRFKELQMENVYRSAHPKPCT